VAGPGGRCGGRRRRGPMRAQRGWGRHQGGPAGPAGEARLLHRTGRGMGGHRARQARARPRRRAIDGRHGVGGAGRGGGRTGARVQPGQSPALLLYWWGGRVDLVVAKAAWRPCRPRPAAPPADRRWRRPRAWHPPRRRRCPRRAPPRERYPQHIGRHSPAPPGLRATHTPRRPRSPPGSEPHSLGLRQPGSQLEGCRPASKSFQSAFLARPASRDQQLPGPAHPAPQRGCRGCQRHRFAPSLGPPIGAFAPLARLHQAGTPPGWTTHTPGRAPPPPRVGPRT
jgi:hypothetical protein